MATILIKKRDTTGAPATGDLTNSSGGAELAVNTFDKRLYAKDSGGTIVEIGTAPSTIDINAGTIDNTVIGGATAAAGTFTTATATTGNITTVNSTTVDTTNIEVTNIKAKDGTAVLSIADSTGVTTQSTPAIISVNSSSDALRITQTGTGNALVVEDSANPDSTPFVVDTSGQVLMGLTAARNTFSGGTVTPAVQIEQVTGGRLSVTRNSANSTAPDFIFGKTRGTALNAVTAVVSGDNLGTISFQGADGTNLISAANIVAAVDGTPGTNDMPGRLVFSTTADGASSPTERMRINSSGTIGIGTSGTSGNRLTVAGANSTATNYTLSYSTAQASSANTVSATAFFGQLGASATATTADLYQFRAAQGTFNAGAAVTNQYGFRAESSLTGATNNYGFYGNIASGTGRWNLYMNGTAENYLGGNLKIGGTAARATTAGTNHLSLFDGTAPAGTLTNGVTFYSDAGEAKVMDAAGNATLLSPHDPVTNEWIYYSVHTPTGKKLRIDMEKMMRFLNDHFDLDFVHEE